MICEELGIKDWPRMVRVGMSEAEKTEHVLALNLNRRHLTREQRQELVGKLRGQGWSTRKIADRLSVARNTVKSDLNLGQIDPPETITGKDGKQYPAKKPTTILIKDKTEAKRVQAGRDGRNTKRSDLDRP